MTIKHLVISGGGPIMIQNLAAIQHLEKNDFIQMKKDAALYLSVYKNHLSLYPLEYL